MHNLCAALGIHTEIKHSRSVNCILIQTAVSRIRCKLIQYTQQCFTITPHMAEISNSFKVIFVGVLSLYSSTVGKKKKLDNRNRCHRQLPELPSVNGPNPALCEASSSSLCNVAEQINV